MYHERETGKCPKCGSRTTCECVDVEVGCYFGPNYCPDCGWSEDELAGKVVDGFYHFPDGSAQRVDTIVEGCERFGLGDAAREAFAETAVEFIDADEF